MKNTSIVKVSETDGELRLYGSSALCQCLRQVAGAQVSVILQPLMGSKDRSDLLARFTYIGHETLIFAEVSNSGEPRYARSAFYRLAHYHQERPEAVSVFIAPYISPETAKLCRVQKVSYLDFAGNCHFAFDGVYLHVEGNPNPAAHSRTLRSLYQPKAECVLRVLLVQPSKPWRLQVLADEASVSIGQVYKVKELLLDKEWLEETNQGIFLTKPQELLAAWAEHYRFSKHQATQFHTLRDLPAFEQTLSYGCQQRNIDCAFTGLAAAARYAPYAAYQRTVAYLHCELPEVQELLTLPPLQLEPVQIGANVVLLTPYDDGVFYGVRQQQDISLVSPLQAYLDLQGTGGRGREAGEVLLQQEIIPHW